MATSSLRRVVSPAAACTLLLLLLLPAGAAGAADALADAAPGSSGSPGVPVLAAPAAPGRMSPATEVTAPLSDHVTDDAGILDEASAQAAVEEAAGAGYGLWVVTTTDVSSAQIESWSSDLFVDSYLGETDLLLVISPETRDYALMRADGGEVRDYYLDAVEEAILPELRADDWDGAVTAAGHALSTASETALRTGIIMLAGGGAMVGGGIGGGVWWVHRRRRRAAQRVEAELVAREREALSALVDADNAVLTASQELDYAVAQFGLTATDEYTAAIAAARSAVGAGLEASRTLSSGALLSNEQRQHLAAVMLSSAQQAQAALKDSSSRLAAMRRLEAEAEQACADTATRATEARAAVGIARHQLAVLATARSEAAVASGRAGLDQAEELLAVVEGAVGQAQEAVAAGSRGTAVQHLRLAQGALAQVAELRTQATSLPERLDEIDREMAELDGLINEDLADIEDLRDDEGFDPAAVEQAVAQARQAMGDVEARRREPEAALARLSAAETHLDEVLEPARRSRERIRQEALDRRRLEGRLIELGRVIPEVHAHLSLNRAVVGAQPRALLDKASVLETQARREPDVTMALAIASDALACARRARTVADEAIRDSSLAATASGSSWGGLFDGPSVGYRSSQQRSTYRPPRPSPRVSAPRPRNTSSGRSSSTRSASGRRGRF
ncbi:MAG: TPM domain-containing protein [Actinomyces sp.]|uniref:TPM domain-containing protein n=1 Tax=Actinomyces sp. TaxID=29317 RepID=UPI0026DB230E|nr:TPM domain-containing protein [Actinomyces sp.]MDO4243998.1 TPM domain-containing protein [Actinomyces sp.]